MNTFTQHIPNFVDTSEPVGVFEFESTEDLLNLGVVQRYVTDDFDHFAVRGNVLMAISRGGFFWWVAGYLKNAIGLGLPEWDGGKYMAETESGEVLVLLSKDVCSVCGDVITLLDGSKLNKAKK